MTPCIANHLIVLSLRNRHYTLPYSNRIVPLCQPLELVSLEWRVCSPGSLTSGPQEPEPVLNLAWRSQNGSAQGRASATRVSCDLLGDKFSFDCVIIHAIKISQDSVIDAMLTIHLLRGC